MIGLMELGLVKANKQEFKFDDIKRYILSTGDPSSTLALKTRTSRSLNLFKALTILDQGMSANGIVVSSPGNEVFTTTKNENKTPNLDSTKSPFGQSLMDAVQKSNPKPRIGDKKETQTQ